MLATILTILVPALWIGFDVAICLRTGYMTEPFSRCEWWVWLLSGIALAFFAVVAGWYERKQAAEEALARHAELHEGQEVLAKGSISILRELANKTETSGQPAIATIDAAVGRIARLESTLDAYQAIFWAPLTSEQKSTLIGHLKELGPHYVRVSNSDKSDCIELARDLRECFEHAQWRIEKLPDSDRWGSAVANGLMFFRRNTESHNALNSGVVRALAAAIPGSPILLYQQIEGDDVDVAVIVGTRKLHQS